MQRMPSSVIFAMMVMAAAQHVILREFPRCYLPGCPEESAGICQPSQPPHCIALYLHPPEHSLPPLLQPHRVPRQACPPQKRGPHNTATVRTTSNACQYLTFLTLAMAATTAFHDNSRRPDAISHQPIAQRIQIAQHPGEQSQQPFIGPPRFSLSGYYCKCSSLLVPFARRAAAPHPALCCHLCYDGDESAQGTKIYFSSISFFVCENAPASNRAK